MVVIVGSYYLEEVYRNDLLSQILIYILCQILACIHSLSEICNPFPFLNLMSKIPSQNHLICNSLTLNQICIQVPYRTHIHVPCQTCIQFRYQTCLICNFRCLTSLACTLLCLRCIHQWGLILCHIPNLTLEVEVVLA